MNSLSDRYCITKSTADTVAQRSFSVNDLMSCCTSCSVPGQPCSGGMIGAPFQYAAANGIPTGEDFGSKNLCEPYALDVTKYSSVLPTFTCTRACSNSESYAESLYKISGTVTGRGVAAMMAELNKGGTIVVAFTVYQDFYAYKSGIYYHVSGNAVGGHATRLIGYGTENGVDYWTIANSWGTYWGEKGYIRIRRGTDEGGMESNFFAAGVISK